MDKRTKLLLGELSSTDRDSRERAAALICNMREIPFVKEIVDLLKNENPDVRIQALTVLGIIGGNKEQKKIRKSMKSDVNISVRIAAMVILERFGKSSFRNLNKVVRNAIIDKVYKKKIEMQTRGGVLSWTSFKGVLSFRDKQQSFRVLGGILLTAAVVVILLLYNNKSFINIKQVEKKTVQPEKMSKKIMQRIKDVQDFKQNALLPGGKDSKNPVTITLNTRYGDKYGDLAQSVYSVREFHKSGMNTLLAFWRKYNFPTIKMERRKDIMDIDTDGETLIFPNLPAMRIRYSLEEGTAAQQVIEKPGNDVIIKVTVDKVVVK